MEKAVTEKFIELLKDRFSHGVLTKEDAVRYTYFLALMQHGRTKHYDVVMEANVDEIGEREIDTLIKGQKTGEDVFIEFKCDRDRASTPNRTQRAADIFLDFFKLGRIPVDRGKRYVIYLSGVKMRPYWRNGSGFEKVMNMTIGDKFTITDDFLAARQQTFTKSIGSLGASCCVSLLCMHEEHEWDLRIFEVL